MTVEIGMLIGIVGCFVGLAGWLSGRDKKIANDAGWKGGVDAKLDAIRSDIAIYSGDIKCIEGTVTTHGERLTAVEESAKQAHKRIDRLEKGSG